MSGAKSLAIVLICCAMGRLPFSPFSAPRPPDRCPDRLSCARHLSPPIGKAKLGLRNALWVETDALKQMTLKLQRPVACRLGMVQDPTSAPSQRTGRDRQNCV